MSTAEKIGCVPQALLEWVKRAEVDSGKRAGVPIEDADKRLSGSFSGKRPVETVAGDGRF